MFVLGAPPLYIWSCFFLGGGIFLAKSWKSCILRLVEPFLIIISSNTYSSSRSIQKHQNQPIKRGKKGVKVLATFALFFWILVIFGVFALLGPFPFFCAILTISNTHTSSRSVEITTYFPKMVGKMWSNFVATFFGGGFFRFFSFFGRKEVYLTNGNKHVWCSS